MDYQAMWEKLATQLAELERLNVRLLDPAIVMSYMGFIEQIEQLKEGEV